MNKHNCKFHPTYKAVNKPSSDCLTCWILWADNPNRKGRLNIDSFKQILIAIEAKFKRVNDRINEVNDESWI